MLFPAIMTSRPADREPRATPADPRTRDPVALAAGRLGLVFTWAGDRWRHAFEVDGRTLATSLEDTADTRDPTWPASPPLVELSTARVAAGIAILAVGRAGRSHYSASFTPRADTPDTILVEIACRVSQHPDWLGSTYDVAGGPLRIRAAAAEEGLPATVCWAYSASPEGIFPLPPAATDGGR